MLRVSEFMSIVRRVDGLDVRVRAVVMPSSRIGQAGVVIAGLLWLPVFTLSVFLAVNVVRGVFWKDGSVGAALDMGYLTTATVVMAGSESGLPALVGLSVGGVGLALGWAGTVRAGKWLVGTVVALLATPLVDLFCWVVAGFSTEPWLLVIGMCLVLGFYLGLPVWSVVWWAIRTRDGAAVGAWEPAIGVSVAALSCGTAVFLLLRAVRLSEWLTEQIGAGAWQ